MENLQGNPYLGLSFGKVNTSNSTSDHAEGKTLQEVGVEAQRSKTFPELQQSLCHTTLCDTLVGFKKALRPLSAEGHMSDFEACSGG